MVEGPRNSHRDQVFFLVSIMYVSVGAEFTLASSLMKKPASDWTEPCVSASCPCSILTQ